MVTIKFSRFFSLFISFSLLVAPLPLSSIAREVGMNISEMEADIITKNPDYSYVYLTDESKNIAEIVAQLCEIDQDIHSPLHALHKHIQDGFSIAEIENVTDTLLYAQSIIEKNYHKLDSQYAEKIATGLDEIIADIAIDESMTRAPFLSSLVINKFYVKKWMHVRGKSQFDKHIRTNQGIGIKGHIKVGKSATFSDNVTINGILSVEDAEIENLTITGSLSFNDLSVVDATVSGTLTVNDIVVENCVNNLCVNELSAVDQSISGTLSANDAVIQNLTVNGSLGFSNISVVDATISGTLTVNDIVVENCVNSLCIENLSAVDQSISGTLSANDAVIQNLTVNGSLALTDISVVDATVSGALTVSDLVVENCVSDLCVNNLSVVDQSISGTLSTNDAVIQNLTVNGSLALTDISVVDATVSGALTVSDLVVENCISDLCVNALSVVDESVSGTLSVNDIIIKDIAYFEDMLGGKSVGIKAPSSVSTSYIVSLPSIAPTANQILQANAITPTNLEWATQGAGVIPSSSKMIYVAKYGNDITGDGSFNAPYLTLSKAISVANGIASAINPIIITLMGGIYVENNSAGPLILTSNGISIVGDSASGVIISPNTPSNDLLLVTNTIRISNITFQSSSPLATGISLSAGNLSTFINVRVINFLVSVSCSGGASASYGFNNCLFINNGTALLNNNSFVECNNCTIFGTSSLVGPAVNTGVNTSGSSARLVLNGGLFGVCDTAINTSNNATTTISAINFRGNAFDIVQTGPSATVVSGCSFELTNSPSDIDIQVSGIGATAEIISCEFSGKDLAGTPQGTGISISDNASVTISGGTMHDYDTAISLGAPADVSSTILFAAGLSIRNTSTDILQQGSTTLNFSAGTATSTKISINDPANVTLAFFDLDSNNALNIGSETDQDTTLLQVDIASSDAIQFSYKSSLYSTQAVGLENLTSNPTSWFITSNNNGNLDAITTDRSKTVTVRLVSDEGSPIGGTSALRGWDVQKNASTAELAFSYQNSDIVGQSVIAQHTVMQLDGVNNQLQLPTTGTQIIFSGDTNLYRDSANVLKTDDNFIVGTLTPDRVVITDSITNQLSSSVVSTTELGYLSGVTSPIQTQLNGKVNKSGDTMTGALQLPAGTAATPSLIFTGSTTTGLSASVANSLSLSTNGVEALAISPAGVVLIDGFAGAAGVVHNDVSGNLSSSLIVNADITNATISNAKLATISALDMSGNIVVRDGSGNFATNMITIDGTVTNSTDVATKGYVDSTVTSGLVAHPPALVTSDSNQTLSGLTTIDGVSLPANDRVLLTAQTNPVENGLWLAQSGTWTRPADFNTGDLAGQAYVLILSGLVYAGSSWLCNTPSAVIDTDPIFFALFSLPNLTTGANVGAGTGLVFKNKAGVTLNFRSLIAGTHTTITTNTDDITLSIDATPANTASTIVSRDGLGNFSAGTITANLTGSASNNVLRAGDTMTGALQLPAGTTALPSLNFTGSPTTGFSANTDVLSFSNAGVESMKINASGIVSIDGFTSTGIVHNNASGALSTSLIVNADVDPAAAITDTKLATISTAGKVANSATTATSANTPNTIVLRDALGNFNASTVIANLTGSASNNVLKAGDTMTGALQLPAGTTALPSLVFTGSTTSGLSASSGTLSFSTSGAERMKIASGGSISIDAFASPGVVHNDSSGNLSSSLIVNADVDPAAAIVDTKLATISTAGKVANSATTATSANTANAIVARDASGNFVTNEITIAGTVTNPTDAATKAYVDAAVTGGSVTGANVGVGTGLIFRDKTGNNINFKTLINGAHFALTNNTNDITLATDATSANTVSTIVARDVSGNFSAGTITANLNGNATTATNFTGSLSGDVTGTQSATVVSSVGGQTAANVAAATVLANAATNLNTASTIVKRDASGNFAAGTITANLNGNATSATTATTATTATNFTGSLAGDVTGTQSATVVSSVGGQAAANVAAATVLANAATNLNTANAIVKRDASGNFAATTITANLNGNATTATTATTATNFTGSLAGDVTGTQSATVVSTVGGQTAANVAAATVLANAATSTDTASAIVKRDASGNFTTNMITIDGTTTNATDVATKAYVDAQVVSGTNLNTPNTFVKRDNTGSFAAQVISMTDGVHSGNLILSTDPSTSTAGNIIKGSNRFIHDFGTNNTFVGLNAGNFTMSGSGANTGIGTSVLTVNGTGANNTAVGASALTANTSGVANTALGSSALAANTSGAQNTAVGSGALFTNTTNSFNTAVGTNALRLSTTSFNTAVGSSAMAATTTGSSNTAVGSNALTANTTGVNNTAIGGSALVANTTGNSNTGVGISTFNALTTGSSNVAIGSSAGGVVTTGNNNIYISASAAASSEGTTTRIGNLQTKCFIAGIRGVTTTNANAVAVLIDSAGQLGTASSSRDVKHDIENMGDASNNILNLRPVTFVYNSDESNTTQYGLIAEEVAEIFPNIVVLDNNGQPETVQYQVLPVLLLNELKKQHVTIEDLKENNMQRDAIIQNLINRIAALECRA